MTILNKECPEEYKELTYEEIESRIMQLAICGKDCLARKKALIESGAAISGRDAERQIAEELNKPLSTIRQACRREENSQNNNVDTMYPEENVNFREIKDTIALKWTGDQESYTPKKYIEAARKTMGSIDIDPASNDIAQEIIKAKIYYSKDDDGLKYKWDGNIFLNPPYSHPEVKYFVDKLLDELEENQQAILLTNNNTDTQFFHRAASMADAVCFTKGRISFYKSDNSVSSPTNGQVFYYFGGNVDKFIKYFSEFGIIMTAV